jgi:hypothetical protein
MAIQQFEEFDQGQRGFGLAIFVAGKGVDAAPKNFGGLALSEVHAELEAAGVVIDIGQLDWACAEVERRVYERSLDRQYAVERARAQKQAENDEEAEWDAMTRRFLEEAGGYKDHWEWP